MQVSFCNNLHFALPVRGVLQSAENAVGSIAFWDNRCTRHLTVWDCYPQIISDPRRLSRRRQRRATMTSTGLSPRCQPCRRRHSGSPMRPACARWRCSTCVMLISSRTCRESSKLTKRRRVRFVPFIETTVGILVGIPRHIKSKLAFRHEPFRNVSSNFQQFRRRFTKANSIDPPTWTVHDLRHHFAVNYLRTRRQHLRPAGNLRPCVDQDDRTLSGFPGSRHSAACDPPGIQVGIEAVVCSPPGMRNDRPARDGHLADNPRII